MKTMTYYFTDSNGRIVCYDEDDYTRPLCYAIEIDIEITFNDIYCFLKKCLGDTYKGYSKEQVEAFEKGLYLAYHSDFFDEETLWNNDDFYLFLRDEYFEEAKAKYEEI